MRRCADPLPHQCPDRIRREGWGELHHRITDHRDGTENGSFHPSGLGFQFGGFVQLELSDAIALRPELIFSFRKAVSDQSDSEQVTYQDQLGNQGTGTQTITQETDTRLSYFQIPVALCFAPNENLRVRRGPSINFLMSAKTTADVTTNDKVTMGGQNYD